MQSHHKCFGNDYCYRATEIGGPAPKRVKYVAPLKVDNIYYIKANTWADYNKKWPYADRCDKKKSYFKVIYKI